MAYEFQKLSEVEALAEVPEGANALIEVNGAIKRVPGSGLGGATGIKTAIIKSSDYDNSIAGLSPMAMADPISYECINMTFEEAYETMANGEPLEVVCMMTEGVCAVNRGDVLFLGMAVFGVPCVSCRFHNGDLELFWTADGISIDPPVLPS